VQCRVKNAKQKFDIPINAVICLLHALCHLNKTNRTHSSKISIFIYFLFFESVAVAEMLLIITTMYTAGIFHFNSHK